MLGTWNPCFRASMHAQLQSITDDMDFGASGNSTRTSLFVNTYTGLNLASVSIIIVAAVEILGIVIGSLGGRGAAPVS